MVERREGHQLGIRLSRPTLFINDHLLRVDQPTHNDLLIDQTIRCEDQTFTKIFVIYNLYLYLLHKLMLSTYKRVVKVSEDIRFYLTYLVFCIE